MASEGSSLLGFGTHSNYGQAVPVEPRTEEPRTYTRRWLVLLVFCFLSIMNNITQYSFSPIPVLTGQFYDVSSMSVNLLALVFMVTGFTTRFAAMWIIDNKGLGYGVFISAVLNFVGNWIRYFPGAFGKGQTYYYWLFLGQSICAIAQSFIDITGPKIAANWFPPKERTTATALSSGPIFMALLLAYAIIPHTVTTFADIPNFLLVGAVLSTAATILVFAFFRGSPPIPPSYSAGVDKLKFNDAIKLLFKKKNFIIMFLVFGITLGSALAFSVLMDQVIEPEGYTNTEASTLGSIWVSFAILGGFIGGPIIDRTRAYKTFILATLSLSTIGTAIFTIVLQFMNHNVTVLSFIVAFVGLGAAGVPAILEATIETIYPVPEASAMGILFLGLNITGVIFVLGMENLKDPVTGSMIPSMWAVVGLCTLGTLLVCFFKPDYQRLKYEKEQETGKKEREMGKDDFDDDVTDVNVQ